MPDKKIANSKKQIVNSKTKGTVRVRKTAVQTSAKTAAVQGSLSAPVYDARGAKHGALSLPKEVFGAKINNALMAQAVRVYLANQRQGNAHTKSRGEITLTTAKWYRQKGTGRARHGAKSAPIFVGGGVAHGPRKRDFSLSLPQKMRKAALYSALSLKASAGEIKVLSGLSKIEPKTKIMAGVIKKITDEEKAKVLLITSAFPKELGNVYRAGRNIGNMEILNAKLLNTYEVLKYKNLIFMKESIEFLGGKL
ncbi:MAG: 50S ribosomal protein L4 [Microgenomates group bacterium GW2011_GWA2_37_6]|nr:MAG: 50S ribosomal protein L4 [Microgenomates group bacterium GW2011_GWA2_37_6]